MKKCPVCGSLDSDDETTCGVCGTSYSEFKPNIDVRSIQPIARFSLGVKKGIGLLTGGVIILLALILFTTNLTGFIIGFFVLLVGVSTMIASASSFKEELGPPRTLTEFSYRMRDLEEIEEEERERKKADEEVGETAENQKSEEDHTTLGGDGN